MLNTGRSHHRARATMPGGIPAISGGGSAMLDTSRAGQRRGRSQGLILLLNLAREELGLSVGLTAGSPGQFRFAPDPKVRLGQRKISPRRVLPVKDGVIWNLIIGAQVRREIEPGCACGARLADESS